MPQAKKEPVDLAFPLGGVVEGAPHSNQPPNTTWDSKNVMPFDVDEDRARGGRRAGLEKVTGRPVSAEKVQMVSSIGIVPGDATVNVAGRVSSFSGDQTMDHKEGFLRYSELPDGTPISLSSMGHKFYGYCNKWLWGAPAAQSTQYNSLRSQSYPLLESVTGTYYGSTLEVWDDSFAQAHTGVTKKTDENGASYISIDPCRFPFPRKGDDHNAYEPYQYIIDGADASLWRNQNESIDIGSGLMLMPDSIEGEHTWNSNRDKSFVSKFEFMFPKTHAPSVEAMQDYSHRATSQLTFEKTSGDVVLDKDIYDPYYVECVGESTFDGAYSSYHKMMAYHSTNQSARTGQRAFGFVLRIGANLDSDPNQTDNWLFNGPTLTNHALGIFFQRVQRTGGSSSTTANWQLKVAPMYQRTTHFNATTIPIGTGSKTANFNVTYDSDGNSTGLDIDAYHTLEIRHGEDNSLDVYFNGAIVKDNAGNPFSFENIESEFSDIAKTGANERYRYAAFFDHNVHCITRSEYGTSGGGTPAYNSADEQFLRKTVAYWATRDWTTRTVDGVSAASNDSRYACSDELRVRSWLWYEMGGLQSVPRIRWLFLGDTFTGQQLKASFRDCLRLKTWTQ